MDIPGFLSCIQNVPLVRVAVKPLDRIGAGGYRLQVPLPQLVHSTLDQLARHPLAPERGEGWEWILAYPRFLRPPKREGKR